MVSTEDPRPSEAPHVQLVVEERFEDADEALSDAADVPGLVKQQTYTVDDALEELPLSNRVRLLMYVTCGIAWTMDGMEILLLAFIGPALRCDWHITDAQAASLTMVVFIGMMITRRLLAPTVRPARRGLASARALPSREQPAHPRTQLFVWQKGTPMQLGEPSTAVRPSTSSSGARPDYYVLVSDDFEKGGFQRVTRSR